MEGISAADPDFDSLVFSMYRRWRREKRREYEAWKAQRDMKSILTQMQETICIYQSDHDPPWLHVCFYPLHQRHRFSVVRTRDAKCKRCDAKFPELLLKALEDQGWWD